PRHRPHQLDATRCSTARDRVQLLESKFPSRSLNLCDATLLWEISSKRQRRAMPAKRSGRKSGSRKYGKAASKSVASALRRERKGTLRSGKGGRGGVVKSREQAIAIGLSEARKKGAKVPRKNAA